MSYIKSYPFQFTGRGSEYFKIWIVNIVLTLLTLGIYSAWAKVRTLRWFYGHTLLDNQSFSYLATPIQILKGRLIAMGLLVIYYLASIFSPMVTIALLLGIFVLTPWIVVSSLRFRARYSSYRSLRFDFTGNIREAAIIYLLLPLLMIPTLGLILPYWAYRQVRYVASNTVYGKTTACYQGELKPFWGVYLLSIALMLLPIAVLGYGIFSIGQMTMSGASEQAAGAAAGGILALGTIMLYLTFPVVAAMIQARTANLLYNASVIGPADFTSTQRARDLIWIYLSNLVLIALTLGIFIPWAKVRLARYRAERLCLNSPQDLEGFVAGQQQSSAATGAEVAEVFDLNFGVT